MTTQKLLTIGLIALVITVLLAVGGALFKGQDTILSTSSVPSSTIEASAGGYEIINGTSVPPEPDPVVNNATLAGVDVNGNGVRDDVERLIAQRWPSNFAAGMDVARHTRLLMTQKGSELPLALTEASFCAMALRKVDESVLMNALLNSNERYSVYYANVGLTKIYDCEDTDKALFPQAFEVINGITVPPEPDPVVNNSTLAGVDMNENGVRDDVERLIAKEFGMDNSKITELTSFARKQQEMLTSGTQDAIFATDQMYVCGGLRSEDTDKITSVLLNTAERNKVYRDIMANAPDIDIKAEQEACTY